MSYRKKILKNGHYRRIFTKKDEDLEQCAKRELSEETKIKAAKIKQFKNYSDPDRDDRDRTISVQHVLFNLRKN